MSKIRCSITACCRHRSRVRLEVCETVRNCFSRCCRPGTADSLSRRRHEFLEENGDEFVALNQALTRLAGELEGLPQKPEEIFNFVAAGAGNSSATQFRDGIRRSEYRLLD